jgi:oxygen-independent coproporphyrinogen-3 oxidase
MEHTTSSLGHADTLAPVLTNALLARMDVPGPRYTSYPTADRFVEAFTAGHLVQALAQRGDLGGVGGAGVPMSIYVHVPFCESVCYYCACNKIVTRDHGRVAAYLKALEHELDLVCQALGEAPEVSQLHFGGGTPTFLDDDELRHLMAVIGSRVRLLPQGEHSIEIDPRTVSRERLALLKSLGFNRISFGVQDFDEAVQQAVHRVQPHAQVEALMRDARALGFDSVNVDLIYGLPRQTPESFARTVRQVALLRPDRIALYGYAHLPTRFKPQRRIVSAELACWRRHWPVLSAMVTSTSAWTTSRCRKTALPRPSARAGCTATSRATARNRTAISSGWACRPSRAWAPPTARTPRPSTSTTTC